jgi:dTDP-4-amino-4,6-dideoxygalactose transaminase
MRPAFPFLDLQLQYKTIQADINEAVRRVLDSQQFILGPEVRQFEEEFATYTGARFAVSCASGSDALLLPLMALGIGEGDEVITTPFTFVATAGSIARLRAKPVFVDIDPETFNINTEQLGGAVTQRTKAIMPVHLFGMAADMDRIMRVAAERNIPVIEDAAQAIGAEYRQEQVGTLGFCGGFSFFPSKNLGGAGDGGLITTNDENLAKNLRLLRNHGSRTKYDYELLGMNSRLDELQAAVLRIKLQHLDRWTMMRQRNAQRYQELFSTHKLEAVVSLPKVHPQCTHIYNQFVVRVPQRDALRNHLMQRGVPSDIYYPKPLHLQPAFKYLGYGAGSLQHAEATSTEVLALPIFPEITADQQTEVVASIADFYKERH